MNIAGQRLGTPVIARYVYAATCHAIISTLRLPLRRLCRPLRYASHVTATPRHIYDTPAAIRRCYADGAPYVMPVITEASRNIATPRLYCSLLAFATLELKAPIHFMDTPARLATLLLPRYAAMLRYCYARCMPLLPRSWLPVTRVGRRRQI